MKEYPALEMMVSELDSADTLFQIKTAKTYDEIVIAKAAEVYNVVLERAAQAIVQELQDGALAKKYFDLWRPKSAVDTWFGQEPLNELLPVQLTVS